MQRVKLYLRAKTVSQDETIVVEQRAEGDFAVKEGGLVNSIVGL